MTHPGTISKRQQQRANQQIAEAAEQIGTVPDRETVIQRTAELARIAALMGGGRRGW